ncbi:MAG: hypothetical protein ACRDNS_17355 [Trebonia sp.]
MALVELNPVELIKATGRGTAGVIARLRPDHRSIRARPNAISRQHMARLYLYQAVAPSRRAVRVRDDGQVGRAKAFATHAIGAAAEAPEGATGDWTRFRVEHEDGAPEFSMHVHRSGLIELLSEMPSPEEEDAEVWVDGVEVARRILGLAAAVKTAAYAQVSTVHRPWRRLARLDWQFDIATRVPGPRGPRRWSGIRFAGAQPPRTQQDWIDPPPHGYGEGAFSNRRRSGDGTDIATLFLERLASDSGYFDCKDAVARTVAEARRLARGPSAPQPPTHPGPQSK